MPETRLHPVSDVIALLLSRAPLNLDDVLTEVDKESGKPVEHTFSDDQEFVVTLPAWVFRCLRKRA